MTEFVAILEPPSKDAGNWSAFFPDFPGCVATAATFEEVVAIARGALALHCAGMQEDGDLLPVPRPLVEILAGSDAPLLSGHAVSHLIAGP